MRAFLFLARMAFGGLTLATAVVAASSAGAQTPSAPQVILETDGTVHVPGFSIPPSEYLSEAGRDYLADHLRNLRRPELRGPGEGVPPLLSGYLARQKALYAVTRTEETLGGVRTWVYTPAGGVTPAKARRVLIALHGGGFTGCWPGCAELESIPIAGTGGYRVVAVDYRQGPDHRFPAASEDVAAVYRALLKTYRSEDIGIYGCSAGGMLTGMALAWFQKEGLPTPGAAGVLCAGLTIGSSAFGGDSAYLATITGEGRPPPSAPPNTGSRPMAYLAQADVNDPLVAPGVSSGVLAAFPPTLVITGTRSIDLSAAVHGHALLTRAGVDADLHVWEGLFHGFFYNPDVPESKEAYDVIVRFFDRYLGRPAASTHVR